VKTLPTGAFDGKILRDPEPTAVLFLAEWCGFCRTFLPAFRAWAEAADQGFGTAIADISDDDQDPRWEDFRIDVVPTIIAFREGREVWRKDGTLGEGLVLEDLDSCAFALALALAGAAPHRRTPRKTGP